MAQQARPKVIGHKADLRAQFTTASRLVVRIFASNCRSGKLISSYFPLSRRIDWDGWLPVHPSPILTPPSSRRTIIQLAGLRETPAFQRVPADRATET